MDTVSGSLGSADLVSVVPGRLRIRVARGPSAASELLDVERALDAMAEVTEVEVRVRAASVVARFDPRDSDAVAARLQALGVVAPPRAEPSETDPAAVVRTAVETVNGAVARRGRRDDLRTLVPLGLGLLSMRQALRGRDRLGDAPWYVLAWYASETFFKFHGAPGTASPPPTQEKD